MSCCGASLCASMRILCRPDWIFGIIFSLLLYGVYEVMSEILQKSSHPKVLALMALRDQRGITKIDLSNTELNDDEFKNIFDLYILPHADKLEILNLGGTI